MDHIIDISYLSGKTLDEVISELTRLKIEYANKNMKVIIPQNIYEANYEKPNFSNPYRFGI